MPKGFSGVSLAAIVKVTRIVPRHKRAVFLRWAWETDYFQPKETLYMEQGDKCFHVDFLCGLGMQDVEVGKAYDASIFPPIPRFMGKQPSGKWKCNATRGGIWPDAGSEGKA